MSRQHKESYIKSIEASVTAEAHADLGAISVPTHVVTGAEDRLTTIAIAETLAGRIRGARLTVTPDAGHLVNTERPAAFNEAVIGFIRAAQRNAA